MATDDLAAADPQFVPVNWVSPNGVHYLSDPEYRDSAGGYHGPWVPGIISAAVSAAPSSRRPDHHVMRRHGRSRRPPARRACRSARRSRDPDAGDPEPPSRRLPPQLEISPYLGALRRRGASACPRMRPKRRRRPGDQPSRRQTNAFSPRKEMHMKSNTHRGVARLHARPTCDVRPRIHLGRRDVQRVAVLILRAAFDAAAALAELHAMPLSDADVAWLAAPTRAGRHLSRA